MNRSVASSRRALSLLYVATVADPIRNFLLPYAAHFRGRGWKVTAAAHGCTNVKAITEAFDAVYELPFSRSVHDLRSLVASGPAVRHLVELISPDIVHVHTPIAGFLTRWALRRMPAKRRPAVIYTAHGFHFHRGGNPLTNMAFLIAERVAGRWTDRLIVINDEDKNAAMRHRLVPVHQMTRMSGIGIDTDVYARRNVTRSDIGEVRRQLGIPADAAIFLMVAEMSRNKRHHDVLTALARLARPDAHLVLAGDGHERSRLEHLAAKLGIRRQVHFRGFVHDVRPLLATAAGLILASQREGLPRSIMEAFAMQTPVIVSDVRGNRELVDPESGILFPVGDINALSTAMSWVLDHPAASKALVAHARKRLGREFDLTTVIAMHERIYRDVLVDDRS